MGKTSSFSNYFFAFLGVLLHYDDPLLRDLYFLDPQWLCDMLAHVVTVREVNPHINNGKRQLYENCAGILLSSMPYSDAMLTWLS